jgi:2-amino-4-hydroxy-6-hydroxymethyldihydropteridine diphosphokinase
MQGIYIALGSNEGDREANLRAAIQHMHARDTTCVAQSTIHETPALMPENAPLSWNKPFLNQVVEVTTQQSPEALLVTLKSIEVLLGRKPAERWAPRPMDLDILAYHDVTLSHSSLQLPHPQLHLREFVLLPWLEIAPHWHWHGKKLTHMLHALQASHAALDAA